MNGVAALRRFARETRPRSSERCELCGAPLGAGHEHLADPAEHALKCACAACAVLFADSRTRFVRVEPRALLLEDFVLTDAQWELLRLPVNLAFFMRTGRGVFAFYPSPAGTADAQVPAALWEAIARQNDLRLRPGLEALLVHRMGHAPEHYLVSVDHCYRLTGLLRRTWRGFSGGEEAYRRVARFFDELRGDAHA
jgi:hypothetical protein